MLSKPFREKCYVAAATVAISPSRRFVHDSADDLLHLAEMQNSKIQSSIHCSCQILKKSLSTRTTLQKYLRLCSDLCSQLFHYFNYV